MNRTAGAYVIPAGATGVGPKINLDSVRLVGILVPTGWVAADITFQASFDDGATWVNVHDDGGAELKVTTGGAGRYLTISPDKFHGLPTVRLRSGTAAAAVDQTAARTLQLVTIPLGW